MRCECISDVKHPCRIYLKAARGAKAPLGGEDADRSGHLSLASLGNQAYVLPVGPYQEVVESVRSL